MIWAHLECVHLVSDGALLEVNLIETLEVYNRLRMLKEWKHCFRRAEAVFWMPKAVKAL